MIGTFRLDPGQALIIDLVPPDTRWWSVTVENIWHECIDPRRRHSSITNAGAIRNDRVGRGSSSPPPIQGSATGSTPVAVTADS